MPKGHPIDRTAIHEHIWNQRNRRNCVQIYQKQMAEELGISNYHLNRIIKNFEAAGRLKKIGARRLNIGVYVVRDPQLFAETS